MVEKIEERIKMRLVSVELISGTKIKVYSDSEYEDLINLYEKGDKEIFAYSLYEAAMFLDKFKEAKVDESQIDLVILAIEEDMFLKLPYFPVKGSFNEEVLKETNDFISNYVAKHILAARNEETVKLYKKEISKNREIYLNWRKRFYEQDEKKYADTKFLMYETTDMSIRYIVETPLEVERILQTLVCGRWTNPEVTWVSNEEWEKTKKIFEGFCGFPYENALVEIDKANGFPEGTIENRTLDEIIE